MAQTSDKKLAYIKEYDRAKRVTVSLKFHRDNDADIIERLGAVDNVQAYIKKLIRADIGTM